MDTKTPEQSPTPNSTVPAGNEPGTAENSVPVLPENALAIIPVRNLVVFPNMVAPIGIGRDLSIRAAQDAARAGRAVGIILQRDGKVDEPSGEDLHTVGTLASILRYV